MITNKVTIELEIPSEFTDKGLELLETQTDFLVQTWKGILSPFKDNGVKVPNISVRKGKKEKVETSTERKNFTKALLDHHLKYWPKADVADQMRTIKQLYETGRSAEELIGLYEGSMASYNLTTWHTVRFKIGKVVEVIEQPTELPTEKINEIKERYG